MTLTKKEEIIFFNEKSNQIANLCHNEMHWAKYDLTQFRCYKPYWLIKLRHWIHSIKNFIEQG